MHYRTTVVCRVLVGGAERLYCNTFSTILPDSLKFSPFLTNPSIPIHSLKSHMLIVMTSTVLSIVLTANHFRSPHCENLGCFTQPIIQDPTAGPFSTHTEITLCRSPQRGLLLYRL